MGAVGYQKKGAKGSNPMEATPEPPGITRDIPGLKINGGNSSGTIGEGHRECHD
jgi:hypothetical protein